MTRIACALGLTASILLIVANPVSAATFSEMGRWVPADANVVVAIDVAKALETPLAKERFWAATLQLKFSEKQSRVMPSAEKQVMAACFDPATNHSTWEVLLIDLPAVPSAKAIADMEGSQVDRIEGFGVIPTRRGGYAVRINDDFVAVRAPGNRQAVTRWIRESDQLAVVGISKFLRDSLSTGNAETTFFVAAIDLDGILSVDRLRPQMSNLRSLKKGNINAEQAASLIVGLKGLVIRAAAGAERLQGTLELEFSQSPTLFEPVAGPLVIEAMEAAGLEVEGIKDFTAAVAGNKIILKGPMTGKNIGRLASLITVQKPALAAEDAVAGAPAAATQPADPSTASLSYFRTVSTFLDELQRVREFGDLVGASTFIDKYTKKIEQVSILNVDPELVGWSDFVSSSLREASYQIRTAAIDGRKQVLQNTDARAKTDVRNYDYYEDFAIDYRQAKKNEAHAQTMAKITSRLSGREAARAVLKNLDGETLKIRRSMTLKYKVEF